MMGINREYYVLIDTKYFYENCLDIYVEKICSKVSTILLLQPEGFLVFFYVKFFKYLPVIFHNEIPV